MQKTKSKMAGVNPTILVITLNVNGLDTPVKTDIVRLDKKYIQLVGYLQETYFRFKDTNRLDRIEKDISYKQ